MQNSNQRTSTAKEAFFWIMVLIIWFFPQSNPESHCFPFIFMAIDPESRLLKVCYNFRLNYPFLIFMLYQNEWKTHFALNFQQKKTETKIPSKQHQHYCRPVTAAGIFSRRHNCHTFTTTTTISCIFTLCAGRNTFSLDIAPTMALWEGGTQGIYHSWKYRSALSFLNLVMFKLLIVLLSLCLCYKIGTS